MSVIREESLLFLNPPVKNIFPFLKNKKMPRKLCCQECDQKLKGDGRFCSACGTQQPGTKEVSSLRQSETTTIPYQSDVKSSKKIEGMVDATTTLRRATAIAERGKQKQTQRKAVREGVDPGGGGGGTTGTEKSLDLRKTSANYPLQGLQRGLCRYAP